MLLEGFFDERELAPIAEAAIGVAVHAGEQVRALEQATLARPIDVHVKANTGMNRLGFAPDEVAQVCARLARAPAVAGVRLMMHFARADDDDGIAEPLARFERACATRRSAATACGPASCSTARRRTRIAARTRSGSRRR